MNIQTCFEDNNINIEPSYYASMKDMIKRIECKKEDASISIHTVPIGARYTIMLITRGFNTDYIYEELHFYQKFCPTYRYSIDEDIKKLQARYMDNGAFEKQLDMDKSSVVCSDDNNLIVLTTDYKLCNNTEYTIQLNEHKITNIQIKELV